MPYRIFHQWLHRQMRNSGIENFRWYFEHDVQALLEPDFLDLQIARHKFQLATQRGDLHPIAFQTHPQQIAESRHHLVRRFDVGEHQRRNGVHRIEQKMRLQMTLQRLQM